MIRYRYGLKPLTRRDRYARNIARSFDFEGKPRLHGAGLPDPPAVISAECGVPAAAVILERFDRQVPFGLAERHHGNAELANQPIDFARHSGATSAAEHHRRFDERRCPDADIVSLENPIDQIEVSRLGEENRDNDG